MTIEEQRDIYREETHRWKAALQALEKENAELKQQLAAFHAAVELLGVSKCPNCDGSGSYAIEGPHGEAQECQCQFCFEKNALLASQKDAK